MLTVTQLSKSYGDRTVVRDVSFAVDRGETLALLGRSGSGKTTTLKMINRLVEPSGGEIVIDGRSLHDQDPVALRRRIGYVIQRGGLFPHYTVAENIAVVPGLLGEDPDLTAERTEVMLRSVGLDPLLFAGKYPSELSGGEAQRVAILRAIAARPPLLLMDEPFSALDPITRSEVRAECRSLIAEYATTVVLVTHEVAEAREMGDRICLMNDGAVVRIGRPEEFTPDDPDPFVASFFRQG